MTDWDAYEEWESEELGRQATKEMERRHKREAEVEHVRRYGKRINRYANIVVVELVENEYKVVWIRRWGDESERMYMKLSKASSQRLSNIIKKHMRKTKKIDQYMQTYESKFGSKSLFPQ